MTERWHSGRTDWTSPAAALAGAGVIPGVALAAYQHRMAQFTTLRVDTPLPVGPPIPSGTSRGHPGRVRGPERKPGPTALRFLRGWAVVDRPRVTRGTIDKWQRLLRCGISTRTGGHVMAERDRGHRRGPQDSEVLISTVPQRLHTVLNSLPDNYRDSGTAVSARPSDHGLCARVGCQRGQRQDAATPGCSSRRRSTGRTSDGRTCVAALR